MRVRGFWGAIGGVLGLIALYLGLKNWEGLVASIEAVAEAGGSLATTLQGR